MIVVGPEDEAGVATSGSDGAQLLIREPNLFMRGTNKRETETLFLL